jgi:hypothetical protein
MEMARTMPIKGMIAHTAESTCFLKAETRFVLVGWSTHRPWTQPVHLLVCRARARTGFVTWVTALSTRRRLGLESDVNVSVYVLTASAKRHRPPTTGKTKCG